MRRLGFALLLGFVAAGREEVNHKSRGIQLDREGDLEGAIEAFRTHANSHPYDGPGLTNLAVALMRKGTQLRSWAALEEAIHVFEKAVAVDPRDTHLNNNLGALETNVDLLFPDAPCPPTVCRGRAVSQSVLGGDTEDYSEYDDVQDFPVDALQDERDSYGTYETYDTYDTYDDYLDHVEKEVADRVRRYVCTADRLTFDVTEEDKRLGLLTPAKLEAMVEAFEECGVVVLNGAFSDKLIQQLEAAQAKQFDAYIASVEADPRAENSTTAERRSKGRYELKAPLEKPFSSAELLRAPNVYPFLKQVLGTSRTLELDTLSSVTSLPQAPAQHWHRDAGSLFDYDFMPVHQPPHGLVLAVALMDTPKDLGPTEFLVKSHRDCFEERTTEIRLNDNSVIEDCGWVGDMFAAEAKKGAAIMFDLRVMHRGGANRSTVRRPILYISYVQHWWKDSVNFNEKQTRDFDGHSPEMKKLLTRLDTQLYISMLEAALEKDGTSVEELQSRYEYNRHDFK